MELGAKLELLRQIPYFSSLPEPEIRTLATGLRERHYRAGDVIFRKGDQSEGLCIVFTGRVRTVITSAEGREQVLKVFGPGRTFADIPVFDDEPQPAEAVAVSESTIAFISQAHLLDLLRRHPDLAIDVIRLFASRLRCIQADGRGPLAPQRGRARRAIARRPRPWNTNTHRGVGQLES